MTVRQPRYGKEEFAQRGHEVYEFQVRSQVEEGNYGKIVAIDIETGAFEVAEDSLTAAKQLLVESRLGITPSPSLLEAYVRLSPHTSPDILGD
jgi:hypothetical protein